GQCPFFAVPESKRKHSDKAPQSVAQSPPLDRLQHHFCIRMPAPCCGAQLGANLLEVVHLAVENDYKAPRSRHHGLVALGGQINDGKTPEGKTHAGRGVVVDARIVWAAMPQRGPHSEQRLRRRVSRAPSLPESSYATHGITSCGVRIALPRRSRTAGFCLILGDSRS